MRSHRARAVALGEEAAVAEALRHVDDHGLLAGLQQRSDLAHVHAGVVHDGQQGQGSPADLHPPVIAAGVLAGADSQLLQAHPLAFVVVLDGQGDLPAVVLVPSVVAEIVRQGRPAQRRSGTQRPVRGLERVPAVAPAIALEGRIHRPAGQVGVLLLPGENVEEAEPGRVGDRVRARRIVRQLTRAVPAHRALHPEPRRHRLPVRAVELDAQPLDDRPPLGCPGPRLQLGDVALAEEQPRVFARLGGHEALDVHGPAGQLFRRRLSLDAGQGRGATCR